MLHSTVARNAADLRYGQGGAGPQAVTSVTGLRPASYSYNDNGRMTAGGGQEHRLDALQQAGAHYRPQRQHRVFLRRRADPQ